jgi:diguanylate cyclase (GGDEF)-like protein
VPSTRVRLRPLLLVGLLVLQAVTVAAVLAIVSRNTEDLLRDAMGRTMMLAVDSVDQRTALQLRPAEDAAELGADLVEDGVLAIDDDAELVRYLDDQVSSNRSISGVYLGRPDGSFLLVSRDGATIDGGTRVKTITVGPSGRRSVTVQRDADGVVRSEEEDPTDPYDPRARPWYEAAAGSDAVTWTEPYVFFESREPGVTAASAARDDEGEVVAVVGVDLSLRDLSTFVGQMEVGEDSRSILIDDGGFMVAAGDVEQVNVDDGDGGLRRAALEELTDPVVVAAATALGPALGRAERDDPLASQFTVDGRRWRVAVVPLAARPSWVAAVIAPEDQFVTNVVDAQRENAVRAVLAGLAVTALALPGVLLLGRRMRRLSEDAVTDATTGLANRRRFDSVLVERLARATPSHPMCVALVDVDSFKQVNDTYGHQVGDQVLAVAAARLRGEVRDKDLVARIGGDEFAVVLLDTELDVAVGLLDRVREAVVERPASTDKGEIPFGITIGVAESHGASGDPPDSRSSLLERADRALYRAKQAGRNRVAGEPLPTDAPDLPDVPDVPDLPEPTPTP